MNANLLILAISCAILQVQGSPLSGRDLDADVEAARKECVNLDLQAAQFRNKLSVFKAAFENDVTDNGATIVQQLRDAGIPAIEADRIQLLILNCVNSGVSGANSLAYELTQSENVLKRAIEDLDVDLSGLGQADRDLRTSMVNVNTSYVNNDAAIKTNFEVTEFSVNEAAATVDFETAVSVSTLWQKIEDVVTKQNNDLAEQKILFDGRGNSAVTALDTVVDQLP